MELAPSAAGGARGRDTTAAARLITHNIELSREDKACARKLMSDKRGQLQASRESALEAERRRKAEVDAVWDED